MKIVIRKRALGDILEQLDWYKAISNELGAKYLNCIEQRLAFLESFPYAFQVRYDNVRMASVLKFPFAMHYIVDGDK